MLNSSRFKKNKLFLLPVQTKILFICYILIILISGYLVSSQSLETIAKEEINNLPLEENLSDLTSTLDLEKKEDFSVNLNDELSRLKKYESQVKKKVDALNSALNELDRSEIVSEEDSPKKSKIKSKSNYFLKQGMGGGNSSSSPIIRDWENKNQINSEPKKPNNKISLLTNELDLTLSRLNSLPIGSPVSGLLTSDFGWRNSPFSDKYQFHQGIDISTDKNTPITSTADGVVIFSGNYGDYGNCVIIIHNSGFETLYAHLAKTSVKSADKVCRGQIIGQVGTSGNSTGPHLHYEIRHHGSLLNPQKYVDSAGVIKHILQKKSDV